MTREMRDLEFIQDARLATQARREEGWRRGVERLATVPLPSQADEHEWKARVLAKLHTCKVHTRYMQGMAAYT